jgi:hypothetical protein
MRCAFVEDSGRTRPASAQNHTLLHGGGTGDDATGKHFDIKIFGSKGVLMFGGDDKHPESGQLELRYHDGRPSFVSKGFLMENTEVEGNGELAHACVDRARSTIWTVPIRTSFLCQYALSTVSVHTTTAAPYHDAVWMLQAQSRCCSSSLPVAGCPTRMAPTRTWGSKLCVCLMPCTAALHLRRPSAHSDARRVGIYLQRDL